MSDRDQQPDVVGRLLEGRSEFSRAERDAMFDEVFDRVGAEATAPTTARRPWWAGVLALAAAVVLAVVVATPGSVPEDEFRARGESANLELRCTGAGPCSVGDVVAFEVSGAEHSYFAAFARNAAGQVIWYFPEADGGQSVALDRDLVDRSVKLGPEHAGSSWIVHAVLSAAPLGRGAIRACFDDSGAFSCADARLLTRELVVE